MNNCMKLKSKIFSIFCIMIVSVISFSNIVFATESTDSNERSEIVEEIFKEWIESYKSDETPENRRIIDYKLNTLGIRTISDNEYIANIEFVVTPVSIENTEWNYSEPEIIVYHGHECIWYAKTNMCYIRIKVENGDYQVEYIGEAPEGYDEFEKRFEEYKKTYSQEEVENIQIQGEETDNQLANQEIEKMSNGIVIGCSIILFVIISFTIVKVIRHKSKNNANK